jgi:hypothetical protein
VRKANALFDPETLAMGVNCSLLRGVMEDHASIKYREGSSFVMRLSIGGIYLPGRVDPQVNGGGRVRAEKIKHRVDVVKRTELAIP